MNENENEALGYNRRDFLKGGSVATLMTMLGGVELFAQTNAAPAGDAKAAAVKIKVAVIGLGAWGREIINTLARVPAGGYRRHLRHLPGFPETHRQRRARGRADCGLQDHSRQQGHQGGRHRHADTSSTKRWCWRR